jgi:hypothetical protein
MTEPNKEIPVIQAPVIKQLVSISVDENNRMILNTAFQDKKMVINVLLDTVKYLLNSEESKIIKP